VHNALSVQVAHTRDELGEEFPRGAVLEVAMVEDVVEKLSA
jgi:hypothetical protein